MNYITATKLQSKLDGEANLTTARKIINKMTQDGFVEAKGNRKLGRRVIHSDLTEKKLLEVKKALDLDAMHVDVNESTKKANCPEIEANGNSHKDLSTCGGLHSIGSDLTRTRGRSNGYENGSIRSEQTVSKRKEHGNTPMSRAEPVASGESFAAGAENGRDKSNANLQDEVDTAICSRSTQGKRYRKASTVREPILQYIKRQKSQAQ